MWLSIIYVSHPPIVWSVFTNFTHGFFNPRGLRSALDPAPAARGLSPLVSSSKQGPAWANRVTGYHPGVLSGLALAGANGGSTPTTSGTAKLTDDGILTALEVAALDLRSTDLAVLSACETGLGEVRRGEGILGLQRAFQVSGARTVVASLWEVDDEATRDLMCRFYENLWQKKMDKLAALRAAQLSILNGAPSESTDRRPGSQTKKRPRSDPGRRRRANPRFWAAWVLSGDPGGLTSAGKAARGT